MAAPTEAQMDALYAIANEERPDGRVSIPLAVAALLVWASELEHRAKLVRDQDGGGMRGSVERVTAEYILTGETS